MFGAYPFAGQYYGEGPALTPDVVQPTIVDGPIHVANLQTGKPRTATTRAKKPSVTNTEQH